MSKKGFMYIFILMSILLLSIIFMQYYFMNQSIKLHKQMLKNKVQDNISNVIEIIENKERALYYKSFLGKIESKINNSKGNLKQVYIENNDNINNLNFIYYQKELNRDIFLELSEGDTVMLKNIFRTQNIRFKSNLSKDSIKNNRSGDVEFKNNYVDDNKEFFEIIYKFISSKRNIEDRLNKENIKYILDSVFKANKININYNFAIYDKDQITSVSTDGFNLSMNGEDFINKIFDDNTNYSYYSLYLNIEDDLEYLFSAIIPFILLCSVFTIFMILVFITTIYKLLKHKKISQMKSDFIDNITHEFKTPISSINLAVSTMTNQKNIGNKEQIIKYADMIKNENMRINNHVDAVLRLSKSKKEINLNKKNVDIKSIIDIVVSRMIMSVKSKGGNIGLDYAYSGDLILYVDAFHMENVIMNILDNANKYCLDNPKINIVIKRVKDKCHIIVIDKGIGMSKAIQSKIFDKFYREHTGNIHNIKGYGLGLSYCKTIVESHNGSINVVSRKGLGSKFIIILDIKKS